MHDDSIVEIGNILLLIAVWFFNASVLGRIGVFKIKEYNYLKVNSGRGKE